jgi:WD40 repeat protein
VSNESVLKRWNLETGDRDVIFNGIPLAIAFSRTGRKIALAEIERPNDVGAVRTIVVDLETGQVTELESRGKGVMKVAFDSTGEVLATCNREGVIHVGPISDEEPHFLLGHEGPIYNLAIDPKGRWIASQGQDRTVRLWPMPDLSKPPLHTLPREELIAKLKTLTNLRVVRDPESATGWTLTHDPFPGWETVPTW